MSLVKNIPTTPPEVKTIPTFLSLFLFGFLYQLVLVYDSLRLKNTIQVIGLCLYNLGMLIYASIQYDQINKAINTLQGEGFVLPPPHPDVWTTVHPYLLAVPCIIAFFSVVMSAIVWKLYDEFAWTIYKHISADLRMKHRFLTFQVIRLSFAFDICLYILDLHCSTEVRLLLLLGLHSPIPCDCHRTCRCRKMGYCSCHSYHDPHSYYGSFLDPSGEQIRNDPYNTLLHWRTGLLHF
jgi:hypothetical protein